MMYNNKFGLNLQNAELSKYVASSTGALQEFWERCEDCIPDFGKEWKEKLSKGVKRRTITVLLDEML